MRLYFAVLFALIFMTGCNETSRYEHTVSGSVIDGYIAGANICADLNSNNACDIGEPATTSDESGYFALSVSLSVKKDFSLIATHGIDTATNEEFVGFLKRDIIVSEEVNDSQVLITPLSTLVSFVRGYLSEQSSLTRSIEDDQLNALMSSQIFLDMKQAQDNPLENVEIYNSTQQLMQTINLLSAHHELETTKEVREFNLYAMQKIAKSFVEPVATTTVQNKPLKEKTLNIDNIMATIEKEPFKEKKAVIEAEEIVFIQEYIVQVNETIEVVADVSELAPLQAEIVEATKEVKTNLKNKTTKTEALAKLKQIKQKQTAKIEKVTVQAKQEATQTAKKIAKQKAKEQASGGGSSSSKKRVKIIGSTEGATTPQQTIGDKIAPRFRNRERIELIEPSSNDTNVSKLLFAIDIDDTDSNVSFELGGIDREHFILSEQGEVALMDSFDYTRGRDYIFNIKATDSSGNTTTQIFQVSVLRNTSTVPPVFQIAGTSENNVTFILNKFQEVKLEQTDGVGVSSYTITPVLENNLSFDVQTGTISGAAEAVMSKTEYNITGINSFGEYNLSLIIDVVDAPPKLKDVIVALDRRANSLTDIVFENEGGITLTGCSFPRQNAKRPVGMSVNVSSDGSTCVLSGVPTKNVSTTYELTATNSAGSSTSSVIARFFNSAVQNYAKVQLPDIADTLANQVFQVGEKIEEITIKNTAGWVLQHCFLSPLPKGLEVNATDDECMISGTPQIGQSETTSVLKAINQVGADATPLSFAITVYPFVGASKVRVGENSTAVFYTAQATYSDTNVNTSSLSYSISGGVDKSKFSIDSSSGGIAFRSPPDFENEGDSNKDNEYNLVISVSNGSDSFKQELIVQVVKKMPLAIIRVNFSNRVLPSTEEEWGDFVFKAEKLGQVNHYFDEVSGGRFAFVPAIETDGINNNGILTANISANSVEFAQPDVDKFSEKSPTNLLAIFNGIEQALDLTDSNIDYSTYDTNEDGYLSFDELQIIFVFAGASAGFPPTAHCFHDREVKKDGVILFPCGDMSNDPMGKYALFTEDTSIKNVTISNAVQQLAHAALNLPLLNSIGDAFAMSSGHKGKIYGHSTCYDDTQLAIAPVHLSAWSKIKAGFVYPKVIASTQEIEVIGAAYEGARPYKIPSGRKGEYFLLTNRVSHGYDAALKKLSLNYANHFNDHKGYCALFPGGVFVTHIDENRPIFDVSVGVVESVETGVTTGEKIFKSFFFKSSVSSLDTLTRHDDKSSGVSLSDISDAGSIMKLKVNISPADPVTVLPKPAQKEVILTLTETLDINYSLTAGDAYEIIGGADMDKISLDIAGHKLVFLETPHFLTPNDADKNNDYEIILRKNNGASGEDKELTFRLSQETPLVVIRQRYKNTSFISTAKEIGDKIFGMQEGQVNHFFYATSNKRYKFIRATDTDGINDGIITVTMDRNQPAYSSTSSWSTQVIDAIKAASSSIDLSSYDLDSDGFIGRAELQIVVVVTGDELSSSSSNYGVWAHVSGKTNGWKIGTVRIGALEQGAAKSKYATFGEQLYGRAAPIGVMAHELGHSALNLIDLYDISGGTGPGIGRFGLMGKGTGGSKTRTQPPGTSPTHFSAYSKARALFAYPQTLNVEQKNVPLVSTSQEPIYYKIPIASYEFNAYYGRNKEQYFLLENRSFGYDLGFGKGFSQNGLSLNGYFAGGMLISHIDERRTSNGTADSFLMKAIQANSTKLDHLNSFFFKGNKTEFTDTTTPNTKQQDGTSTGISITNISEPGEIMYFDIKFD